MRVEVYWNLHKKCFSVRDCKTGRVVGHTDILWLKNPKFIVRKSGRDRVLREGRKNVHAFVRGDYGTSKEAFWFEWRDATYNPYKYSTFVDRETEKPLDSAKYVMLESVNNTRKVGYIPQKRGRIRYVQHQSEV